MKKRRCWEDEIKLGGGGGGEPKGREEEEEEEKDIVTMRVRNVDVGEDGAITARERCRIPSERLKIMDTRLLEPA